MSLPSRLASLWRNLIHGNRVEEELHAELRGYAEMLSDENVRKGMNLQEARRAALLQVGGIEQVKEQVRSERAGAAIETVFRDVRYGARTLAKSPGFTFVAVLTLALGIGANTAIFSVVDAVLIHPLAYPGADRLMWIDTLNPRFQFLTESSYVDFRDWQRQTTTFESMTAFTGDGATITGGGPAEVVPAADVTRSFFHVFGTPPALGREFAADEFHPGTQRPVVIGYGLWQRRFGGMPGILGKPIRLDLQDYTVVGVMPRGFAYPYAAEIWKPLVLPDDEGHRANWSVHVVGRLKEGKTREQAQAEMSAFAERFARLYPQSIPGIRQHVVSLKQHLVGDFQFALLVLQGSAAFVLLIACANVANLLLGRTAARQREISLRGALGAGRGRIFRQLMTESLLMSLLGGGAGILLAYAGLGSLLALAPADVPGLESATLHVPALIFALAVAIGAGLLFGAAPGTAAWKHVPARALQEGSSRGSVGRTTSGLRAALVCAEVALALTLSVGAGLFLMSLLRLMAVNPGFQPRNVLSFSVELPGDKYPKVQDQERFFHEFRERLAALPGVNAVAVISPLPFSGGWGQGSFSVEGQPLADPHHPPMANDFTVGPDYFQVMRIPLLAGRGFTDADNSRSPAVVIIDEVLARTFFPDRSPIGQRLGQPKEWRTIVGVVGHVSNMGLDQAAGPEIYTPFAQAPGGFSSFVMRTSGPPAELAQTVRQIMASIDGDIPVTDMLPMDQRVSRSLIAPRFRTILLGLFGALAFLLAALGIYGVLSYSVAQRTREIGIRLALGALPRRVMRQVILEGVRLAALGEGIGVVLSLGLARLVSSLLFHTAATDLSSVMAIALVLAAVAVLACYFPARRATHVDPLAALRHE
jgi:putative ABC transport system permease protein